MGWRNWSWSDGRDVPRLTRSRTRPPLIVQQALYPDESMPDMAYVFLANPTGGLLDGDCQEVRVEVGCGAKAHITTQSATKIFTMDQSSAEQRVELNVAAGGYLEYLPDPLIPFRNAALQQGHRHHRGAGKRTALVGCGHARGGLPWGNPFSIAG